MGGGAHASGNDVWGWTDPASGREFALFGRSDGTAFVEVSDPNAPVFVGELPPHGAASEWRDIKVYADHALIVSEADGHGLQVLDLAQLLSVATPPVTFAETAHDASFGNAHNIAVNETTGYAYVVGSDVCAGGLHILDVSAPAAPTVAGCFDADGYTHDVQCVVYTGPDPGYLGREICFAANEDTLTIVDVTSKAAPVLVSRTTYAGAGYVHQGWLTEDQAWFLLGDEFDEIQNGHNARTYVVDVTDLEAPVVAAAYTGPLPVIDHNEYVLGSILYQANYAAGLRLVDLTGIASGDLCELGYMDFHPADDSRGFVGSWSVYPFFPSGTVVVGDMKGLGIARPDLASAACLPDPEIVQSSRQVRCLNAASRATAAVARAQGRVAARCVSDASRERIADAQACLMGDSHGWVSAATTRLARVEQRRCAAEPPSFGFAGAAASSGAAVAEERALWSDLFGPDLEAAVATTDPAAAACQLALVRGYERVLEAGLSELRACQRRGLRSRSIRNRAALEACLDQVTTDPSGRIAKARSRFDATLASACSGVDLATAFPGLCASAPDLASCADERGRCRLCRLFGTAAGLSAGCDLFDDGAVNASCPLS